MSSTESGKKLDVKFLKNSWIQNQVDTHLIFGSLANHVKLRYIIIPLVSLMSIYNICTNLSLSFFIIFTYILAGNSMRKFDRSTRLMIGWVVIKFTMAMTAFIFMVVGFPIRLKEKQPDAFPILLLGLIWLPFWEFFPKITKYQRYLTIARLILTIPMIYLIVRSGNYIIE